ncbi:unnamed protein product [Caenorhabditis angaria]|uniref:non-specific serine/threonine protein kinase n=1 Tax=Caenorhabditis angaria TaxID=860376 RepID=A0A9P1IHR2_9PELO|nr:unnamed protein product [Caenorhabditis angaria]
MKTNNLQKSKTRSTPVKIEKEPNTPISPETNATKVTNSKNSTKKILKTGVKILSAKQYLWKVLGHLGSGGFGDVFKVEECQKPGQFYAMKTEVHAAKMARLRIELQILSEINDYIDENKEERHFCDLLDNGSTKEFSWIVMTLIGPALDSVRRMLRRQFSKTSVINMSLQILDAIRLMHAVGFIHRDLKPSNICVGVPPQNENVLFLLDFGISRRIFKGPKSTELRKERKKVMFFGTRKFCSRACHLEMDQGRKDDIETYIYTILDLMHNEKGLPWSTSLLEPQKIIEKKTLLFKNPQKELHSSIPKQFYDIIEYVGDLKFADSVDYKLIENKLRQLAKEQNVKVGNVFDWSGKLEILIREKEKKTNNHKKTSWQNEQDGEIIRDANVSELRDVTHQKTDRTVNQTRRQSDIQNALMTVKQGQSKKRQATPDSKIQQSTPAKSKSRTTRKDVAAKKPGEKSKTAVTTETVEKKKEKKKEKREKKQKEKEKEEKKKENEKEKKKVVKKMEEKDEEMKEEPTQKPSTLTNISSIVGTKPVTISKILK